MVFILFGVFLVALFIGVPVAFSLGLASFAYLLAAGIPLDIVPQKMFSGIDSFVLLCIPGFILAGNLMGGGGITERIVKFSNSLVGHIRGGLALADVGASMVFAGISGTAAADAASIGSVMIPAMKKDGYDAEFASAVTASASTTGPIIPPSLPMIIAGTLTGLSVSKLFIAGAIPGLLIGLGTAAMAYYLAVKRGYPKGERSSLKQIVKTFIGAFWAVMMLVVVLWGIIGGTFTPTEAAIIAVVYALVVGLFIYKELKWKDLPKIFVESAVQTASIMLLVAFANVFAWILSSEQIPQMIADFMLGITENKYLILLLVNLLLLFVGMFMETIAALIILFPVLLKVATSVGVDPIHFAIICVLNLVLGLLTPPVGVCLYITSSIGRISLVQISKAVMPFLIVNLIILALVTYVPPLTLFLPSLLVK
ncbi:TRAP transporter large permease [Desulfotomaculum nigrificans]|uniref:TRAP transporter large permease n=1 Tax=Desulfotomaculum nigrificans TaxID=1565 RepID=UPI0001FADE18|nr:TRAP transporter large permease [Desulfotomaculum nigrificans]